MINYINSYYSLHKKNGGRGPQAKKRSHTILGTRAWSWAITWASLVAQFQPLGMVHGPPPRFSPKLTPPTSSAPPPHWARAPSPSRDLTYSPHTVTRPHRIIAPSSTFSVDPTLPLPYVGPPSHPIFTVPLSPATSVSYSLRSKTIMKYFYHLFLPFMYPLVRPNLCYDLWVTISSIWEGGHIS